MAKVPPEIMLSILAYLPKDAIVSVSLTNWNLRNMSLPYLFNTLKVSFSMSGLERLERVSSSFLSKHVKVLYYDASELIDQCKVESHYS